VGLSIVMATNMKACGESDVAVTTRCQCNIKGSGYMDIRYHLCSILHRFCAETSSSFMKVREGSNVWAHASVHCIGHV
jgi:hypothetical protein